MGATLGRWLVWPMLIISVILWLGVSVIAADVVHTLVKSNFDFARSFGSVSSKTIVSALIWSLVVGVWVSTSTSMKNLAFGACAVVAWDIGLTVVTTVGIDWLWSFRNALIVFGLIVWGLEVIVAAWLLRLTTQPLSFGIGLHGVLSNLSLALACLLAAKAAFLWVVPGVSIRL